MLRTWVNPKTLRDASIAEVQEALRRHVRLALLEPVQRAKFPTLVRNPNEPVRGLIARLQRAAFELGRHE